jgi:hypothetical protein
MYIVPAFFIQAWKYWMLQGGDPWLQDNQESGEPGVVLFQTLQ